MLLLMLLRDWFDWSGWIATMLGTLIALIQFIPVLISYRKTASVQNDSCRLESGFSSTRRGLLLLAIREVCTSLLKLAIFLQPLVGLASALVLLFMQAKLPADTPEFVGSLYRFMGKIFEAATIVVVMIVWGVGARRTYKEFKEFGLGWWIVPISGAMTAVLIGAFYCRLISV